MSTTKHTIGIIGSGPMATYLLKGLIQAPQPLSITVFEAASDAGCGMPYRAGMNADYMYCNAFSREIPAITQRLATWLGQQDDAYLETWDLERDDIDAREFYPRVLVGAYMASEFAALVDDGREAGHEIKVLADHKVIDIAPDGAEYLCDVETPEGRRRFSFQWIVIATGHVWPDEPRIDEARLLSPWPYTNVFVPNPGAIGILGSSLSAIDTIVALGHEYGTFTETDDKTVWFPKDGREDLSITMVSYRGIMPEPDFYYPYPYAPLVHIHPEAVKAEVKNGASGLLQRVFTLLIAELNETAPDYMARLGAEATTIEGFADAYFQHREEVGGLRALKDALADALHSITEKETQPHRYALLRGHENFEVILEHLDEEDWQMFMEKLMPVFGDCYAAVPHISVRRILALYDAGVLDILPTGPTSRFKDAPSGGVTATTVDGKVTFGALIDARGQSSSPLTQLPFASLTKLFARPQAPLREPYRLTLPADRAQTIYCLAMPQLLERHPFSQGLPNCHAIGRMVSQDIIRQLAPDRGSTGQAS